MHEMKNEQCQQDVLEMGFPNIESEDGGDAAGRFCLGFRVRRRRRRKRSGVILHRSDVEDVVTAQRRADGANRKNDLVACGEGHGFEQVSRDEGSEHVGDGEGDVACACHARAEAVWDGFGEEGIEADTERREGNRHEKGQADERPDLTLSVEEPGERNPQEVADAKGDGRPKDRLSGFSFADPVTGGDGEEQADDGGCGGEQADLQAARAEACGVHVEKVDGGAAQNTKPGNIEIEVCEIGTVFFRNIGLSE